ncbi:MAG: hypothetical protein ABR992_10825 [Solirubrobacteraceae bacterium]|jgi:hypothetical protein
MSLTLAITIIVLADLALIGVLAFVMSRAKLLTPHAPAAETVLPQHRTVRHPRSRQHTAPARTAALTARA